ncbi:hypothetical protein Desku_1087 [Desulfofundulus kuznetsovii DSM 6115]|uniref:Holin n=1 Tax=Desulfofundulus kuznetsovii (strain DSM 6115 / VKM B-1805 / 17) TaxID=760568 RepID=A0AAU8PG05_DESK7|nr:hypothetical protein Desku_1087 [Desulfofundulus kuznetsovii DSM 6115]
MKRQWIRLTVALVAGIAAFAQSLDPSFPAEALQAFVLGCLGLLSVEAAADAVPQLIRWVAKKATNEANQSNRNDSQTR